jgi:hypothetical protein
MPKKVKELSALEVGRLKGDGLHLIGGVPGLGLQIADGARSWILRFALNGRRPELGLGGLTARMGSSDAARRQASDGSTRDRSERHRHAAVFDEASRTDRPTDPGRGGLQHVRCSRLREDGSSASSLLRHPYGRRLCADGKRGLIPGLYRYRARPCSV